MGPDHEEPPAPSSAIWRRVVSSTSTARRVPISPRSAPASQANSDAGQRDRGDTARRSRPGRAARAVRARRQSIDDVERGSNDSDWGPEGSARKIAFRRGSARVRCYAAAGIQGIRSGHSNPVLKAAVELRVSGVSRGGEPVRAAGATGPIHCCWHEPYRDRRCDRRWLSGAGSTSSVWSTARYLGARIEAAWCSHPRRRLPALDRPGSVDRLSQPLGSSFNSISGDLTFLMLTKRSVRGARLRRRRDAP